MADAITPKWAAEALSAMIPAQNPALADAVVVVTVSYGLGGVFSATGVDRPVGRRIVRLAYAWSDIEPFLELSANDIRELCLSRLAAPGEVLRARVRAVSGGGATLMA